MRTPGGGNRHVDHGSSWVSGLLAGIPSRSAWGCRVGLPTVNLRTISPGPVSREADRPLLRGVRRVVRLITRVPAP